MKKEENFALFYALSIAMQLGFFIVAPIGGFIILGIYIDKYMDTSHLFVIIGILVGLIVTVYEVWHILKPLFKNKK